MRLCGVLVTEPGGGATPSPRFYYPEPPKTLTIAANSWGGAAADASCNTRPYHAVRYNPGVLAAAVPANPHQSPKSVHDPL